MINNPVYTDFFFFFSFQYYLTRSMAFYAIKIQDYKYCISFCYLPQMYFTTSVKHKTDHSNMYELYSYHSLTFIFIIENIDCAIIM